MGYDCAGIVTETGQDVHKLKVGVPSILDCPNFPGVIMGFDRQYLFQLLKKNKGSCSEFFRCSEEHTGLKPPSLSFEDVASIPLAAITALQALRLYRGDLAGKTVFMPAGCSIASHFLFLDLFANDALVNETGLFACQLPKHAFRAGRVITSLAAKIPRLKEFLGGGNTTGEGKTLRFYSLLPLRTFPNHCRVVDYTKSDPRDVI